MRGILRVAAGAWLGWMAIAPWGIGRAEAAEPRAGVLVIARKGASEQTAVRVERDLRNLYDFAHGEGLQGAPRTLALEPRFDVGNLSKGEIEKARRHFNDAQRALEQGDADEAMEQLFRAERFYNRAIPFASDHPLLKGIYYYYYLARRAAGLEQQARDAYCAYVSLTRNLAGSAGPLEQFEPLADKCGETPAAGTGELRVTANVDGAHVYVDNRPVGVIGREEPYADPFAPAGPHLVEVRKAGYARWGELRYLQRGKSESLRAQLKPAKNRAEDFDPVVEMPFEGPDAFGEEYLADFLFQTAERFRAAELVLGFLEPQARGQLRLVLFTWSTAGVQRQDFAFKDEVDGHRPSLAVFAQGRFGRALDPADAVPTQSRFAPTLFKVE